MDTRTKVSKALHEIYEKAVNDSTEGFSTNYSHHFIEVISALIDSETKSWRDAHAEAIKNIKILGTALTEKSNTLRELRRKKMPNLRYSAKENT